MVSVDRSHRVKLLVVTELLDIAINDFGAKKSAHYS